MTTATIERNTTTDPPENTQERYVDDRVFSSEIRRIDSELDSIKKSLDKQEDRFILAFGELKNTLQVTFDKIDQRFDKIDQRFDKLENTMEARFEKLENTMEARFKEVDQRFKAQDDKLDSNFKWLVGIYIPLTGMLLAAFYAFATFAR